MRNRPSSQGSRAPNRPGAPTLARRAGSPPRSQAAGLTLNGAASPSAAEARLWRLVARVLVGLLAIALGLVIAGPHRVGDYFTETDFYGAYAAGARLVQHGRLVPSRYTVVGPGYDVALALVGFVVPNLFLAAELLAALSACAVAWLWFALLDRRLDARYGVAAIAFLVTNATFFQFGYSVTTDAFAIALQALALFLLLAPPRPGGADAASAAGPSRGRIAAAGLVMGAVFLTRYNAVALLPAGLVAIAAGWTGGRARRMRDAVILLGAFLVPVAPWVAWSLAHGGTLALQLHHNIAYEVFARARGITWDDYQRTLQPQFPNLGAVIARDPGAVFGRMLFNVGDHLRSDAASLLGWPVAIAAIAGVALAIRDRRLGRLAPLLVAGALLFLTLVPVFYSERYSLALLPVYATLAGAAFASPTLALAVTRRRVWLKPALAILTLALVLPAGWRHEQRALNQLPHEVLDLGRVLRSLRRPGDRVLARKAHIAFYGDCQPEPFPFADSLAALAAEARRTGTRWMYYSWPEAEMRPAFFFLLDTSAVVPGLTVRAATLNRPAVLYEIGTEFGATPAWVRNDTLRTWHVLRAETYVDTSNASIWQRFGVVSWMLSRYPVAEAALEHAAERNPNDPVTFATLGRTLVAMGRYDDAYAAFGRAYDLRPDDADTRVAYGFAAYLSGRERAAADVWRPAIGVTVDPRVLRAMAAVYAKLGDAQALAQVQQRMTRGSRT